MQQTISVVIDSGDVNNIISLINSLEELANKHKSIMNVRFTPETFSLVLKDKDCFWKVKEFLDKDNVKVLCDMTFSNEDMQNAITYGFIYHRDSMNNDKDVPLGNKLQWLIYYSTLSEDGKKQDAKNRVDKL